MKFVTKSTCVNDGKKKNYFSSVQLYYAKVIYRKLKPLNHFLETPVLTHCGPVMRILVICIFAS
jgi:hypothetical protein